MSNYRKNKTGVIVGGAVIVTLIVAAVVLGVLSSWYTNWDVKTWFGGETKSDLIESVPVTQPKDNGGAVIDKVTENGIKLASTKISPMSYAANGVSPLAETAYTLTATVTPAAAYVQGIIWTVEFVNPSSEWATGETVTDYITVTPSGDNNHTATVACLSSFGEQIRITATSEDNEAAKAECLVDYGKRFRTVGGNVTATRTIGGTQTTSKVYDILYSKVTTVDVETGGRNPVYSNTLNGSYTMSDGTIMPSVTEEYTLQMSEGLKSALSRQGLSTSFTDTTLSTSTYLMFDRVCISNLLDINYSLNPDEWAKLAAAISDNSEDYDFMIRYYVHSEYDSQTTYAKIKLNAASMLAVTNVSLDQNNIVF